MPYHFGPLERPIAIHFPKNIFGYIEVVTKIWFIPQGESNVSFQEYQPYIDPPLLASEGSGYYDSYFIGGVTAELYDGSDPSGTGDSTNYKARQIALINVYDTDGNSAFPAFDVVGSGRVFPSDMQGGHNLNFTGNKWVFIINPFIPEGFEFDNGRYGVDYIPSFAGGAGSEWIPEGPVLNWPGDSPPNRRFGKGEPVLALQSTTSAEEPQSWKSPLDTGHPPTQSVRITEYVAATVAAVKPTISNVEINGVPCSVLGYRYKTHNPGLGSLLRTYELYALCALSRPLEPLP